MAVRILNNGWAVGRLRGGGREEGGAIPFLGSQARHRQQDIVRIGIPPVFPAPVRSSVHSPAVTYARGCSALALPSPPVSFRSQSHGWGLPSLMFHSRSLGIMSARFDSVWFRVFRSARILSLACLGGQHYITAAKLGCVSGSVQSGPASCGQVQLGGGLAAAAAEIML